MMTDSPSHSYMSEALELARFGRATVSPNPMVGCILVKKGRVIGRGWHQRAGEPHAEVYALREAGLQAIGATAYVTLEPCCHFGRTPPCTQALIEAGVKTVYAACLDPNPLVAGKGMQALEAAGIEVHVGPLELEARQLNEIFFHFIQTRRPFVIAKWAMSLDGLTVTHPEDSRQISGPQSQEHTQQIRQVVDAILVGSQTALRDNPQLTARTTDGGLALKQPLRLILCSQGGLPLDLKLLDGSLPGKTMVVTTKAAEASWCQALEKRKVEVLCLPADEKGQVSLQALLDWLGQNNLTSLLVEGGRRIHASFFEQGLVNKVQMYLAPLIIASLKQKKMLPSLEMGRLGHDYSFSVNL